MIVVHVNYVIARCHDHSKPCVVRKVRGTSLKNCTSKFFRPRKHGVSPCWQFKFETTRNDSDIDNDSGSAVKESRWTAWLSIVINSISGSSLVQRCNCSCIMPYITLFNCEYCPVQMQNRMAVRIHHPLSRHWYLSLHSLKSSLCRYNTIGW